jgi:hypothetical protein
VAPLTENGVREVVASVLCEANLGVSHIHSLARNQGSPPVPQTEGRMPRYVGGHRNLALAANEEVR